MRIDPGELCMIDNWTDLGAAIGVKANIMAYALRERDNLQKRIKLGERIVYRSERSLRFVQGRMTTWIEELFDSLDGTEAAIAYRKGLAPETVIKETAHAKLLIHFDIRHYYDNITLETLERSLVPLGFSTLGARLVGRYNCVRAHNRTTLQQGSPASPVLSNIVGHHVIDLPAEKWLAETFPEVSATYLRYCDNVALFVHSDDYPEYFYDAYREFMKRNLKDNGFRTHKWSGVRDNHPKKNQYFLGMVLNAEAKKERPYVSPIRAALFNWCRYGINDAAQMFMRFKGLDDDNIFIAGEELVARKFKQTMLGKINYISRINEKQGLMLKKLYALANFLDSDPIGNMRRSNLVEQIKKYRDPDESVDNYVDKVKKCLA